MSPARTTAIQILNVAEQLAQQRGFNGFSYADIAERVGVSTAAIHHHYASKALLGERLIERYMGEFFAALAEIHSRTATSCDKLKAYVQLYADVLETQRMCLCGMLAAEIETLPDPMPDLLQKFFLKNNEWVAALLSAGDAAGEFSLSGADLNAAASAIVGGLEGAMLLAKMRGGVASFRQSACILIEAVCKPR